MLDTHKLIYILPEVAYVTEMLPGKKQHTFTIHDFRQINGEFIKDDTFVIENILKLFSKVDPETYHIILPDSLFTNTIVSTTETGDAKIKKYIADVLLPSLDISQDTHLVESFVLTEFKGVAKVQISALEKELVAPLRAAATQYDIKLNGVSPLSWTVKSVVSLEPSVTVMQIGSQIYTALQYIGVDQATISPVADLDIVSETIKTLKGAEPSIQTIYLLSNSVVEDSLKDNLKSILPLQQLATFSEDDTKMPSYVKQIIEAGMRTLAISDYPVPKFELGKATEEEMSSYVAGKLDSITDTDSKTDTDDETEEVSAALPTPTPVGALTPPATVPALEEAESPELLESDLDTATLDEDETEPDDNLDEDELATAVDQVVDNEDDESTTPDEFSDITTETDSHINTDADTDTDTDTNTQDEEFVTEPTLVTPVAASAISEETKLSDTTRNDPLADEPEKPMKPSQVDLSQFTPHSSTKVEASPMQQTSPSQPVIKNQSGIGNMLKMLLITLVVFAITVAVGVGVGLGILTLTNKSPTSEVTPTETPAPVESIAPSPSPEASPAAEINREELSVLIVNATSKAGYAGGFKSKLDALDYKTVQTGNAKGDYEEGMYVLMSERDDNLISSLGTDLGLDLEYLATGYDTEDAAGTYDAVVVLGE